MLNLDRSPMPAIPRTCGMWPRSLKSYVADRPGHDRRYLLNSAKIRRELGWEPEVGFEDGMRRAVEWYVAHEEWWRPLKQRLTIREADWG